MTAIRNLYDKSIQDLSPYTIAELDSLFQYIEPSGFNNTLLGTDTFYMFINPSNVSNVNGFGNFATTMYVSANGIPSAIIFGDLEISYIFIPLNITIDMKNGHSNITVTIVENLCSIATQEIGPIIELSEYNISVGVN